MKISFMKEDGSLYAKELQCTDNHDRWYKVVFQEGIKHFSGKTGRDSLLDLSRLSLMLGYGSNGYKEITAGDAGLVIFTMYTWALIDPKGKWIIKEEDGISDLLQKELNTYTDSILRGRKFLEKITEGYISSKSRELNSRTWSRIVLEIKNDLCVVRVILYTMIEDDSLKIKGNYTENSLSIPIRIQEKDGIRILKNWMEENWEFITVNKDLV